jgi:hypothetical protein
MRLSKNHSFYSQLYYQLPNFLNRYLFYKKKMINFTVPIGGFESLFSFPTEKNLLQFFF